ncbi:MAG: HEAT repeat domain-containing protein, partial [Anaerolineae bacterium]
MLLSQTLEYLLDIESPFKPSLLYGLSKLESEEVERLRGAWPLIPLARRRRLVKELIEIAETNFEVDFDAVFRWGLQDDDPEVREASIEGLWENEEPALMTEFLHLLQNDPSIPVRAAAALALGRFMLLGELQTLPADR